MHKALSQAASVLFWSVLVCAQALGQSPPASAPAQSAPQGDALNFAKPDPKRAQKAVERGGKAEAEGRLEEALADYDEAAHYAPQQVTVVSRGATLRSRLVREHVEAGERYALAGNLQAATKELAAALLLDPGNDIVMERLAQMNTMVDTPEEKLDLPPEGLPRLEPNRTTQRFRLQGDAKNIYEQVAAAYGIKVTFDPDFVSRNVKFYVENVDFRTAMSLLETQTGAFWRPLDRTLIFVAADTQEKRKEFDLQAEQTFALPSSVAPEEMTEALRLVREITGATRVTLDTSSRSITVRDSLDKLRLAGTLIHDLERSRNEILLEIEMLEVDRDKARKLGITPPASSNLLTLSSSNIRTLSQATSITNLITLATQIFGANTVNLLTHSVLVGGGASTFLLALPGTSADFSESLSLVHSGRQVLLRAQDGKPASFFVGDRFPVTLSLLSGSLGNVNLTSLPGALLGVTFPETQFTVGIHPSALVANKFTGGSLPDLAVVFNDANTHTFTILQNQDNGNFVMFTPQPIALSANETGQVAIATGVFRSDATKFSTAQPPDVVLVNSTSNNISVLLGNADANGNANGTFTEATGSPFTVGHNPGSVVVADFNGDGFLDIAVANEGDSTISVFKGNGAGAFTEFPGSPFALAGILAISSTSLPGATLQIPYSAPLLVAGGKGARTWSITAGSLPNGLALNTSTGAITGTPTVAGNSAFTVRVADSGTPQQSATATLNLSVAAAAPLLAIANSIANGNVGGAYDGVLTATGGKPPYTWSIAGGSLPTGLSLAASTGAITGTPKAAGSSTFTVQVTDSSNPALTAQRVFTLNPFAGPQRDPVALVTANFRNLTLANANNAPAADLAVVNEASNNVTVLLDGVDTSGNVFFTEATNSPLAVGTSPVAIAAADLNTDGVPDLAVVNQIDDTVTILLGNASLDGTFTQAQGSPLPTATKPTGIVIANFANGTVPDIAVTNETSNTLGVYLGQGQGIFAQRIELPTPAGPSAIITATLTSSGLPDVALVAQDPAATQGMVAVIQDSSSFASTATGGAGQTPYPGSEFIDLGIKVKATPVLHSNNEVTLQLELEIKALSGTSVNGIPVISNRSLTQTVRVKLNETSLIGGLLDNEETKSITGLPGFARLPGVGYAFGRRDNSHTDQELIILVTPRKLRFASRETKSIYAGKGDVGGATGGFNPVGRPPAPPVQQEQ